MFSTTILVYYRNFSILLSAMMYLEYLFLIYQRLITIYRVNKKRKKGLRGQAAGKAVLHAALAVSGAGTGKGGEVDAAASRLGSWKPAYRIFWH